VSGLATGARLQMLIADRAITGGNHFAAMAEMYNEGSSSDLSGVTNSAIFQIAQTGDPTGAAANNMNAIDFADADSDGTGNMIYTNGGNEATAPAGSIRISINGVTYYMMFFAGESGT